jgi:hypothetical protein
MTRLRQLTSFTGILVFIVLGTAATRLPQNKPRNLKVLPKDISDHKLDSIMDSYNKALGVKCEFCHAPDKKNASELDFALDDNPMKEQGRKMIRLNIQVNKDYFYYDSLQSPEYLTVVTCITCHRGDPMPADLK